MLKRFVLTLFLAAFVIAANGQTVPKKVIERFGERNLLPIEGVWQWNSGAMVVIESIGNGRIVLTLVESPDPLVDTPKVIGSGQFGGTENTYNIELTTQGSIAENPGKKGTAKFIAKITNGGRLSLTPYSTGIKVNVWRLVPYLFRFSVTKEKKPANLDGAIKIWPALGSPEFPVIL